MFNKLRKANSYSIPQLIEKLFQCNTILMTKLQNITFEYTSESIIGRRSFLRQGTIWRHPDRAKVRAVFHEELLQLGQDVFPIGVLSEGCNMRANFVHQNVALFGFCYVYHFLHNVIGKLIFHHDVQGTLRPKIDKLLKLNNIKKL